LYCCTRTIARWQRRYRQRGLAALHGQPSGPARRLGTGWAAVVVIWALHLTPRASGLLRSRWCCQALAFLLGPRPVVSLQDAFKAADDFVLLRTTAATVRDFVGQWDWTPLRGRLSLEFLNSPALVLGGLNERDEVVLTLYDASLRRRLELKVCLAEGYDIRRGIEFPRAGLQAVRIWEAQAGREVEVSGEQVFLSAVPARKRGWGPPRAFHDCIAPHLHLFRTRAHPVQRNPERAPVRDRGSGSLSISANPTRKLLSSGWQVGVAPGSPTRQRGMLSSLADASGFHAQATPTCKPY
jgi:hypothetical protein